MKTTKNFSKPIVFFSILILMIYAVKQDNFFQIKEMVRTNISEGLRLVKITEEKSKIKDKNITISIKMPEIHYDNREVERYINTYIRKNINKYVNHQRQISDIRGNNYKATVDINYHVAFENSNLINIVIYKNITEENKNFKLEKDSYVFDLKTGQRIYLDNFLKNNDDYEQVIEKYIRDYVSKNNMKVEKGKIAINKYTPYMITDGGICVYFNPYRRSEDSIDYEFRIPNDIFKNKIKIVETNEIVANIDTQTITKNNKYINSVINIPIIITSNKEINQSINDKIRGDIMNFYVESQKEAQSYYQDYEDTANKFIANADFDVKKNSDNMLSISIEYYKYSGGAHGYTEIITYNIDMLTGKDLKLNDLFKANVDYKSVIDNEIRKQIEALMKKDESYVGVYEFKGIDLNQKFYIQDDNLVIYFDLYDIAPYAAGFPEFNINVKVINHILKEEYIQIFK